MAPPSTVEAAPKLQGKNPRRMFSRRRDRAGEAYAQVGIPTFDVRAGQAEAATYQSPRR